MKKPSITRPKITQDKRGSKLRISGMMKSGIGLAGRLIVELDPIFLDYNTDVLASYPLHSSE